MADHLRTANSEEPTDLPPRLAHSPPAAGMPARSLSGLPPAFIFTAGYDPLRDDGKEYADRLTDAGVQVTYRNYEGMIHGFFWMSGVLDQARTVMDEVDKEVRAAFGTT